MNETNKTNLNDLMNVKSAITNHQKYENVLLVQYPNFITTEFLIELMNELQSRSVIYEHFILVNIGNSFKNKPSAEHNDIVKNKLKELANLKHIIFVSEDVPIIVKLTIKFTMGILHRDKYAVVKDMDEADSLIEKLILKM